MKCTLYKKCNAAPVTLPMFSLSTWDIVDSPLILLGWILGTLVLHQGLCPFKEYLPDSCQLYVIGLALGLIFNLLLKANLYLFPALFFLYLLPPIALDAGDFMPKKAFFNNVGTILLYAVVGTMVNTAITSSVLYLLRPLYSTNIDVISILLFSTLISPTDPVSVLSVFEELHVPEQLFILVAGESLFNDAFGIVLYNSLTFMATKGAENAVSTDILSSLASFFIVSLGSIILGTLWAALPSLWTRLVPTSFTTPLVVLGLPYLCYLVAERVHMSGMLAIVSCGLFMSRYIEKNLESGQLTTVNMALKTWAVSSDSIIFTFLGISTISLLHHWDWVFITVTLVTIVASRFFTIFLLTFLANLARKNQIDWKEQVVLAFSGIRGPICYGLVQNLDSNHVPARNMLVTTAVVVIVVTCLLQGMVIKPFLSVLKVKTEKTETEEGEAVELSMWQKKCLVVEKRLVGPCLLKKREEEHDSAC